MLEGRHTVSPVPWTVWALSKLQNQAGRALELFHLRCWKSGPAGLYSYRQVEVKELGNPSPRGHVHYNPPPFWTEDERFQQTTHRKTGAWSLGAWKNPRRNDQSGQNLGDHQSFPNCKTWLGKPTWDKNTEQQQNHLCFKLEAPNPTVTFRNQGARWPSAFKHLWKSATTFTQRHLKKIQMLVDVPSENRTVLP